MPRTLIDTCRHLSALWINKKIVEQIVFLSLSAHRYRVFKGGKIMFFNFFQSYAIVRVRFLRCRYNANTGTRGMILRSHKRHVAYRLTTRKKKSVSSMVKKRNFKPPKVNLEYVYFHQKPESLWNNR